MMRRYFTLLFFCLLAATMCAQQMSDQQVIDYVKQAREAGKNQHQMTAELLKRGVTPAQVERIRKLYESSENAKTDVSKSTPDSRLRKGSQVSPSPWEQKEEQPTDSLATSLPEAEGENQIFGHNLFRNRNLSFEPSLNLATPANYRLGPGDEVIIDVWGASERTIREVISPEGAIQVQDLGPVYLSGLTIQEANNHLQQQFTRIYSGIGGNQPNSQIRLTLGDIRSIQVDVMGEVVIPGTYRLSSFASIFHALYKAGGVSPIGTLRSVQLVRRGKVVATVDIYDLIMKGQNKEGLRLEDGDVITVNPYQSLVRIAGKVKRPMFYEMKPSETIATLLRYTGGFTGDAFKKSVRLVRKSGSEYQVFSIDERDYAQFRLDDGDSIDVGAVIERFENRIEVSGAVFRPGVYQLNGEVNTVKQLIKKAEGLRGDAYLNRALLYREREDYSQEMLSIDLNALMSGLIADIPLRKEDHLYIPELQGLQENREVSIYGEVMSPGVFPFAENMTVEDLIIQAGGLREAASLASISVSRRQKMPNSRVYSEKLTETFTFDIRDGLPVGMDNFRLEPFDLVQVRRSPSYQIQRRVTVTGEVLFGGDYVLQRKNERISDVMKRAGGVTPDAYVAGARLLRKMSDEERLRARDIQNIANRSKDSQDSISTEKLAITDVYTVGIDLSKALAHPGSDHDVVLREGDVIYIPEFISTVKISGSVMFPNTVTWQSGQKLKYYINMAGGYDFMAKKRDVYIVYLNGTVSRAKRNAANQIQPGCEIIVPSKKARQGLKLAEILSITSTTTSVAAMVATLVNVLKKN